MLVLAAEGGTNPLIGNLIWLAVMFAMLYFLMIRPQQKEQRERAEMIRALKPGDKILTNGGLIGVITKVDDLSIKIRVAERVEVEVIRTGVARKLKD
ncbi:MAG TPA: preprotein translocase subunit YajC [Firmicutes bacterium]|jgi:preprotein translocase subunit YajC|nr:preprotein translocase subunit YajC [Bacillota bacterium]